MDNQNYETLMAAWVSRNNDGEGYAVGGENDHINDLAGQDGLVSLVIPAFGDVDPMAIYRNEEGDLVGVCECYGPWAVTLI